MDGEETTGETADLTADLAALIQGAPDELGAPDIDAIAAKVEAEEKGEAEAKQETQPEVKEPAEPKVEEKPDDRALARLVAREEALAAREKEAAEAKRQLESLSSKLRRDPMGALKEILGEEQAAFVARAAMAQVLPADKVPAQYKDLQAKLVLEDRFRAQEEEIKTLRAEIENRRQAEEHARYVAEYESGVSAFLTSEDAPSLVKKLAVTNPEKARARVMRIVREDAAKKAALGEGTPLSPAEAAKILEAELSELASVFGDVKQDSTQSALKTPRKPSLDNRDTAPGHKTAVDEDLRDMDAVDMVSDWMRGMGLKPTSRGY